MGNKDDVVLSVRIPIHLMEWIDQQGRGRRGDRSRTVRGILLVAVSAQEHANSDNPRWKYVGDDGIITTLSCYDDSCQN